MDRGFCIQISKSLDSGFRFIFQTSRDSGFKFEIGGIQDSDLGLQGPKTSYRPRSEGDNVLGSVRPSVRQCALSRLNRLTYDLDIWYVG